MGFLGKFFIAIFAGFVARGAWALYCHGYTPCPGGLGGENETCKLLESPCNGVVGCKKYKLCNIFSGETHFDVLGTCHLEGETCYSNRRACSEFATQSNVVICPKANQDGDAVWDTDHWVVNNCTCGIENAQFETFELWSAVFPIWCDDFYATYRVLTNSPVNTVQDKIIYTATSAYCKKCHPGYLPNIMAADNNGVATRPLGTSGNWGVVACPGQVTKPDYAPGCTIDFDKPDHNVGTASCKKQCPEGFETDTDGATQIEQCKSDGTTYYEDGTGYFSIPELASCG